MMDCKDYKRIVFLFEEASDADRKKLADHVSACNSCRILFEQRQQERTFYQKAFATPEMEYPTVFTANVMERIAKTKNGSRPAFAEFFHISRLRPAMTVVSALMGVFFFIETSREPEGISSHNAGEHRLNSSAFLNNLKEKKPEGVSLADCIQRFNQDETAGEVCFEKIISKKAL